MAKANKAMQIPTPEVEFRWSLDTRESRYVFSAAKEKAVKDIQKARMRLIELEYYQPQPQTWGEGKPMMYDHKDRAAIKAELEQWITYYERIRDFCLMAESVVMHMEAEKFGQEMKQYYESKKGAA